MTGTRHARAASCVRRWRFFRHPPGEVGRVPAADGVPAVTENALCGADGADMR